jgi:seryl-tRNA synthetase
MFEKLRESFSRGIERIKWFSTVFSERLKIEIAIVTLLYQSDEMHKKREELYRDIGRRVYELRGNSEKNIFKDRVAAEAIEVIEKLEKGLDELNRKVSEVSGAGA